MEAAQQPEPWVGMRLSLSPTKELDWKGCQENTLLHFNESCIVGGEALGVRRLDAALIA